MPFQDDSGIERDRSRGPIVAAVTAFSGQIERAIAVNIVWALQLAPAFIVLSAPDLPSVVQVAGILYSVIALIPATGWLYAMARHMTEHDYLNLDVARDALAQIWLPSLRVLLPLFGTIGLLAGAAAWADEREILPLAVGARLLLLLWVLIANWWGALLVEDPAQSVITVARRAAWLAWRHPLETAGPLVLAFVTALFGVISVGGVVLAVPVLVALIQTTFLNHLTSRYTKDRK